MFLGFGLGITTLKFKEGASVLILSEVVNEKLINLEQALW